jgi:tetratricopeptide (TPR) repeat protein
MKVTLLLFAILAAANAQTRVAGLEEPPELLGTPVPPPSKLTSVFVEFGKLLEGGGKQLETPERARQMRAQLTGFVERHRDFADAYALRATIDLQILHSHDYAAIGADINKAMELRSEMYRPNTLYAMRAKVWYQTGQYRQAVDDLEAAVRQNPDNASHIFGCNGIKPNEAGDLWQEAELDNLVERFPQDYRTRLLRGLYWTFFTTFTTDRKEYYSVALREFHEAARLSAHTALPHYFLGRLYTHMAFFTAEVWRELDGKQRDLDNHDAAVEYTKAIQTDPKFREAYAERAAARSGRKEFAEAIPDYGKVIELDRENSGAYNDRGLAYLETGRSLSAVQDLTRSIEMKVHQLARNGSDKIDLRFKLLLSLESRADAYARMGEPQKAIADLTEAIRLYLLGQGEFFSMEQFRSLYFEYKDIPDELLRRKLQSLFWPHVEWEKVFLETGKDQKGILGITVYELYSKRGDAYLQAGDFRRGTQDFGRIASALPDLFKIL